MDWTVCLGDRALGTYARRMANEPVCLLQWLRAGETEEVWTAWKRHYQDVNIALGVARSRDEFEKLLVKWLEGNNTQFLYIGSHGAPHGIGSSASDYMPWERLAELLRGSKTVPVVWLGACYSSSAAIAWSGHGGRPPAAWLTTFPKGIPPAVCLGMVDTSIKNTRMTQIVFVDEELPGLRATVSPLVDLFYPVRRNDGTIGYVHADSFPTVEGKSFKDYLAGAKEDW